MGFEIFDGGFAIDAGEEEHGEEVGSAAFDRGCCRGMSIGVGVAEGGNCAGEKGEGFAPGGPGSVVEGFEEEVIEEEGEVEGGIAVARGFAIEDDEAVR